MTGVQTCALPIYDTAGFTGTIANFSTTGKNSIELEDVAYSAADSAVYQSTNTAKPALGGTLDIMNGSTVVATLKLAGNYSHSTFDLTQDTTTGGTIITDPPSPSPLAFNAAMAGFAPTPLASSAAAAMPAEVRFLLAAPHAA